MDGPTLPRRPAHGLDRLLRGAWERGAVLCGVSAGMNCCWFEASNTDSFGPLALLNDGLGPLPVEPRLGMGCEP